MQTMTHAEEWWEELSPRQQEQVWQQHTPEGPAEKLKHAQTFIDYLGVILGVEPRKPIASHGFEVGKAAKAAMEILNRAGNFAQLVGTPEYLKPAWIDGTEEMDPKVALYALAREAAKLEAACELYVMHWNYNDGRTEDGTFCYICGGRHKMNDCPDKDRTNYCQNRKLSQQPMNNENAPDEPRSKDPTA